MEGQRVSRNRKFSTQARRTKDVAKIRLRVICSHGTARLTDVETVDEFSIRAKDRPETLFRQVNRDVFADQSRCKKCNRGSPIDEETARRYLMGAADGERVLRYDISTARLLPAGVRA
jgi:hypothetical protein